jgi:hypothetical protein
VVNADEIAEGLEVLSTPALRAIWKVLPARSIARRGAAEDETLKRFPRLEKLKLEIGKARGAIYSTRLGEYKQDSKSAIS